MLGDTELLEPLPDLVRAGTPYGLENDLLAFSPHFEVLDARKLTYDGLRQVIWFFEVTFASIPGIPQVRM
jgi:hypothetical protein